MKKILFLVTGGTITSNSSEEGLVSSLTSEEILHYLGGHHGGIKIICEDLLRLDSSNMQPGEWQLTARRIAGAESGYDSIVLSRGTDTMAYTAGALSLMLRNLGIPLIIAESQLPLFHSLSNGVENIRMTFTAVCEDIQGVYICFNRKTMLATRVVKVRTIDFDAFESVNIKPCGRVDARSLHIGRQLLAHPTNAFVLGDELCKEVVLIKLIPGMNLLPFNRLAGMDIRGIVIEASGAGGINFVHRDLISRLETVAVCGISVVVCSQCLYECSDSSVYQTGQKVLQHDVIQGYGMTDEACVTKLMQALRKSVDTKEIKRIFETNCVNEITLPQACAVLLKDIKQKLLSIDDPQLVEGFCFLMSAKQYESRGRPSILLLSV